MVDTSPFFPLREPCATLRTRMRAATRAAGVGAIPGAIPGACPAYGTRFVNRLAL
ncbi:TPA: hypothetical protein QDB43_002713 [Burkholderia vietnamiensis]|nr:hypothetical protein [Burkholderia vietnamiensis]